MGRLPAHLRPLLGLGVTALLLGGCGGGAQAPSPSRHRQRAALTQYLHDVEPIRLAVNRLLLGADPILSGYHGGRLSAARAGAGMASLERQFAAYALDVAAISPSTAALRQLHSIYAHTYVLEDSYLSALANGLSERDLDGLPNTEAQQRAAIIQWRIGLEVLARHASLTLPRDLQIAGRGEIRPSPDGS
jgi:hypothetical protein